MTERDLRPARHALETPARRWLLDDTAVIASVSPRNRRPASAARAFVAGLTVLLLAGACSEPLRVCTEIGATNGVQVTVKGLGASDELRQVFVEVCLMGTCGIQQLQTCCSDSVFVDLATIRTTDPVDLAVTVRTDSGTVLVGAPRVPTTPRVVQPNGPGCEPTAYQAQATIEVAMVPFSPPGSAGRG